MDDMEFVKQFEFKTETLANMDCFHFIPMFCSICNLYGISVKYITRHPDDTCILYLDLSEHDRKIIEEYEKERGKFMTRKEYEEHKNKIKKYKEKMMQIRKYRELKEMVANGNALSMDFIVEGKLDTIDIHNIGDGAGERLKNVICNFFEQEAQAVEKSMEEI